MAAPTVYAPGTLTQTPPNGFVEIDNGGPQKVDFQMTSGTFTVNGATPVTVVAPNVTATSVITWSLKTVGGTVGAMPAIQTITPGTGFTIAATAGDTSVYAYLIIG